MHHFRTLVSIALLASVAASGCSEAVRENPGEAAQTTDTSSGATAEAGTDQESKESIRTAPPLNTDAAAPAPVAANPVVQYETAAYCQQVSDATGGSYELRGACIDREDAANRKVAALAGTDARILDRCKEVGSSAGGSYQILLSCIEQELDAR